MSFTRLQNGDINRVQDQVDRAIRGSASSPIPGSVSIEASLTTSQSRIAHRLGREPAGYIVVDRNANAVVYSSSPFDSSALYLTASAAVNVTLLVF